MTDGQIGPANRAREEQLVKAAFARLDLVALGTAVGSLVAVLLWLATAYLLVKGAPPGQHVGPHLSLLANFLPGYSVSWGGSLIGLVEGFAIGFAIGAVLAASWNLTHHIWLMLIVRRTDAGQQL
jgi:hypothetical protein